MIDATRTNAKLIPILTQFFPKICEGQFSWRKWAGFSGNAVFEIRLSGDSRAYCLKSYPRNRDSLERLTWIHAILSHVGNQVAIIAVPLKTILNEEVAQTTNHFWEITPWMPGKADFLMNPTDARLQSAAIGLAQFHLAAASFPGEANSQYVPSAGVCARLDNMQRRLATGFADLQTATDNVGWPEFQSLASEFMSRCQQELPAVFGGLEGAAKLSFRQQPVIRDIWHEHVLFSGDAVSGIIDFDAMRVDTPALDLARLLADLARRDAVKWQIALSAYETICPLPAESAFIRTLSVAGIILSGLQWIEWISVERREFADRVRVLNRFEELLEALQGT